MEWHWGVGPSVKHVLGVQGWSYTVPEKPFFNKRVWFSPLFEEKKYQKSFRKTKSDPPTFSDFWTFFILLDWTALVYILIDRLILNCLVDFIFQMRFFVLPQGVNPEALHKWSWLDTTFSTLPQQNFSFSKSVAKAKADHFKTDHSFL